MPTTLGGVKVLVGGAAARLYFVSEGQINFVVPARPGETTVVVDGVASIPTPLDTLPHAPGLFILGAAAPGPAAALHADGRVVSEADPAWPGETLQLFLTGLGTARDASPQLFVGDIEAQITFAGPAPGFSGLDQINFVVPDGAPIGATVSLRVSFPAFLSNTATLAIRADQ